MRLITLSYLPKISDNISREYNDRYFLSVANIIKKNFFEWKIWDVKFAPKFQVKMDWLGF